MLSVDSLWKFSGLLVLLAIAGGACYARVGLTTNRLLHLGVAFDLVFAAAVATPIAAPLGIALPPWEALLLLAPFPLVVWGADEPRRAQRRRTRSFPHLCGAFPRPSSGAHGGSEGRRKEEVWPP